MESEHELEFALESELECAFEFEFAEPSPHWYILRNAPFRTAALAPGPYLLKYHKVGI